MLFRRTIIIICYLFILSACVQEPDSIQVEDETNSDEATSPTLAVPLPTLAEPSQSQSAITGQVVSIAADNSGVLVDTYVRLAQVYWNSDKSQGSFVIDESSSPTTLTNSEGYFVFNELVPQDYVIVIGDLYGQHVILSNNDGSAQIFTTENGQVLDVGILQVNLKSPPVLSPSTSDPYPALSPTSTIPSSYP